LFIRAVEEIVGSPGPVSKPQISPASPAQTPVVGANAYAAFGVIPEVWSRSWETVI